MQVGCKFVSRINLHDKELTRVSQVLSREFDNIHIYLILLRSLRNDL